MHLDRKALAGVSGVLVFALTLGFSTASLDQSGAVINGNFGIQSSAGANAAIDGFDNNTSAGATDAMDGTVDIVDQEKEQVGQGNPEEENTQQEEIIKPVYESFGYTNLGMAIVKGNLNIRKEASVSSTIVGKMTGNSACEILGEEKGFYKIETGSVEGYVSKDYIITGEEALILAQEEVRNIAKVTTASLRVREQPTTDAKVVSSVNKDEELVIVEVLDGWLKVEVDNEEGYISADYVTVSKKLKVGSSIKELQYGEGVSQKRVDIVNYALQFVGNSYVWGGTSLTKGVDCSGFTMQIYKKFGVTLPHYSGSQTSYGKKITKSQLQPGDLIFYGENGKINHVAMYIGNGQIVHAANKRDGIKISNAFYRTPICYRSYLN